MYTIDAYFFAIKFMLFFEMYEKFIVRSLIVALKKCCKMARYSHWL